MRRRYLKPPPGQGLSGDPFIKPKVQTKLPVGKSGEKYEVEADRMAGQVVNESGNGDAVQKMESLEKEPVQTMEEEEPVQKVEEEEAVQAKSEEKNTKQPSIEYRLKHSSGGNEMDAKTKMEMEQKFGTDFSHIRIHSDIAAAQMCQELGAQAFTRGNYIYFNEGKYNPNSIEGKRLLAHELTHTIQQGQR